jgi:hypothetical protein
MKVCEWALFTKFVMKGKFPFNKMHSYMPSDFSEF